MGLEARRGGNPQNHRAGFALGTDKMFFVRYEIEGFPFFGFVGLGADMDIDSSV